MKEWLKIIIAAVIAIGMTLIPAGCFFYLWSFAMDAVPIGEWAGLIKVGITVGMIILLTPITILLSILCFVGGSAIAAAILE